MDPLFLQLVRVVNLTARPFQQRGGRAHQLTLNEWRVMAALGSHTGSTATEVADLTGLDKMAVSRALTGLKRHKRVQRHDDPTDQRSSRLYPTRIGRDLFGLVHAQAHAREAELFGGVDADELARLGATLDKLVAAVAHTTP